MAAERQVPSHEPAAGVPEQRGDGVLAIFGLGQHAFDRLWREATARDVDRHEFPPEISAAHLRTDAARITPRHLWWQARVRDANRSDEKRGMLVLSAAMAISPTITPLDAADLATNAAENFSADRPWQNYLQRLPAGR